MTFHVWNIWNLFWTTWQWDTFFSEYLGSALSRSFPVYPRLVFIHLASALYKFRNLKHRQTDLSLSLPLFFFTFHMDAERIHSFFFLKFQF